MGYSKEQLLARLKDLQIEFSQYEHPPVVTVEAQAQYVGNLGGEFSKNLFLKDKKHRFYIVSALPDTKVDMKVLSQRLGLGKGGLRLASEESLLEILQVPLGSIAPFALVNESARDVALLLDKGFKTQERCFFHALSNDMSISLNTNDLDKFLKSISRNPAYVDLEAKPTVGKDQPPDLATFVPSGSTVLPDPPKKVSGSQSAIGHRVVGNSNSKAVTEKAVKPSNDVQNVKEKSTNAVHPSNSFTDIEKFVDEILDRLAAQLLSETKEGRMSQQGEELGTELVNRLKKSFCAELKNLATMFKNTAYTEGFHAGRASSLR